MKLRNTFFAALHVLGLAAVLPAGYGAQNAIPEMFYSGAEDRGSPIWVSAHRARTPEHRIDWKLFSPNEAASLRMKLSTHERLKAEERTKSLSSLQVLGREPVQDENCVTYETSFNHLSEELEGPGFEGLVKSAEGIYSASIADISQGFFLGSPASVLKLEIAEVWKPAGGVVPATELYGVYPFARFAIGESVFCSGVPGSIPQPKIGQRVIVFINSKPMDHQQALFEMAPEYLIAERSDGGVILPRDLKNDAELCPVQTLAEVEELLRLRHTHLRGRL